MTHKGVLTHGVIFDPTRNDLYIASRGRGAFLNDRRLRVSRRDKLIDGLIGTGFPFRMFEHVDAYVGMLKDLMRQDGRRAPARLGGARPGRSGGRAATTASGRSGSPPGTWPPAVS